MVIDPAVMKSQKTLRSMVDQNMKITIRQVDRSPPHSLGQEMQDGHRSFNPDALRSDVQLVEQFEVQDRPPCAILFWREENGGVE